MSSRKLPATISSVITSFATFFERVMVLYNLTFQKEEKDHKVEDVKRFALELYQSGHISDYIKETIDDTVEKFTILLPGQIKKRCVDLDYLDAFINKSIVSIELPSSVHRIGQYAFCCCENLLSINLPGSITQMGSALSFLLT